MRGKETVINFFVLCFTFPAEKVMEKLLGLVGKLIKRSERLGKLHSHAVPTEKGCDRKKIYSFIALTQEHKKGAATVFNSPVVAAAVVAVT